NCLQDWLKNNSSELRRRLAGWCVWKDIRVGVGFDHAQQNPGCFSRLGLDLKQCVQRFGDGGRILILKPVDPVAGRFALVALLKQARKHPSSKYEQEVNAETDGHNSGH